MHARNPSIETTFAPLSGYLMLALESVVFLPAIVWLFVRAAEAKSPPQFLAAALATVVWVVLMIGFFVVEPNQSRAMVLFGRYRGTVRKSGFWWTNPFTSKKSISLRAHNLNGKTLKVNDLLGNPIEIGAIVVWRVVDTAEAMFEVDDYENYTRVQSESAVRTLASSYAYDSHAAGEISLVSHTNEVATNLMGQLTERLAKAGVEVKEARISHLAYAPEIAQAMLQRQQASAIIAARYKIVEGAVGMVENALELLAQKNILHLDDERKAAMVSNLLVVLCGERGTTPIVNAGTLYN